MADELGNWQGLGNPHVTTGGDAYLAGQNLTVNVFAAPAEAVRPAHAASTQAYLTLLAEAYQWLELQGINEAGTLRVELEKVYVALKAEPESDYGLRHMANLHGTEVEEAAGGTALDLIEPTRLAVLDAENVRRSYRPLREAAKRARITEVQTFADAFRLHSRMVLLGGPGSGKTTLGRWLALQLARGMLRQLPHEVEPESGPALPDAFRVHLPAGISSVLDRNLFLTPGQGDQARAIRLDELPARGTLALFGRPVRLGQVVGPDQLQRLTFTPAGQECGRRYAHLRYSVAGGPGPSPSAAVTIDVGVHILVPVSQIDPDHPGGQDPERLVDLGPARVPIFLRLAHFARELAERERAQQPTLSLEEYLGQDPDSCGRADGCTPQTRNALLRALLEQDRAVVVLDGLDELPEAKRRTVTQKIQNFIERTARPNPANEAEEPWRAGGNQVLVTSRYVGYPHNPVRSRCAHFGIQAMQRPAVEHFARAWTRAISAELGLDLSGRSVAEALIAEIYDDSRPAMRELATNPLLVTILAMVYWVDGHLPDQRAAVYDRVVENLLRIWLDRPECRAHGLGRDELLAALEPLAADMQEDRNNNGLISLGRIAELIEGPLSLMRGSVPMDRSFRPVLDALLTTIRKHVGLLAEQADDNYAFFHRTFQEFLAARHLLSDREHAAARIVERLDDPLWREPLLLAVGLVMASSEWGGAESRTRLLQDVLAADDEDLLIPRGAMLVVSALPQLDGVPKRVVDRIVEQFLGCYAFIQRQSQAERLRKGICDVFARLREGPQADLVAEAIGAVIRRPRTDRDHAAAAAEIMLRIDWFTTGTVDALLQVVHRDQAALRWPVHWALLTALGQTASDRPPSGPAPALNTPALNTPRLVAAHLPMRRLLESSPALTEYVRGDVGWLWLVVALYGGIAGTAVRERLQASHKRHLEGLRLTADDEVEEPPEPPPAIPPMEFGSGDIVHDLASAELSRAVLRLLRLRRPVGELAEVFRRVWRRSADPAGCAEAVVGLAALGEDVVPLVREALADPDRRLAARAALERFQWLRALLREPLIRSTDTAARTLPEEAPEEHQLDLLRIVIEARAAAGGGPLPVSNSIPSRRFVDATSDPVREALDAEDWAYRFSGLPDEASDSVAAALGPVGAVELRPPGRAARGWSELAQARNQLARLRLPWPQQILAPRCDTPVEHCLAMLDGLLGVPEECDYLAGRVLARSGAVLADHPELVWETLAVCRIRGQDFVAGYLAGAGGGGAPASACAKVAVDLAAHLVNGRPDGWSAAGAEAAGRLRGTIQNTLLRQVDRTTVTRRQVARANRALLEQAAGIADPYLRFRALTRLAAASDPELAVRVRLSPLDLFQELTDAHDRARALEWIMLAIPDLPIGLGVGDIFDLDRVLRLLSRIEDPENRARAQCRLALLAPERLEDLLGAAGVSLGEIADPRRRAEAVSSIRFALEGVWDLTAAFDAVADSLPEGWLRDKALGRASRLVAAHRSRYGAGALAWRLPPEAVPVGAAVHRHAYPTGRFAWGVLYLETTAAEVVALGTTSVGDTAQWEMLLGPEWQAGVEALVAAAADGGLRLTPRAASVVNRVVQSGRAAVLERLWGHLESPDPQAMAIATRWTTAEPEAERWKALVQVEAGRLTPENLDQLVELLSESTDRLRLRSALALHGPTPYGRNRERRWSVSRVGAEAIEAVARHCSQGDHAPAVRSALSWMRSAIHHDDAEALNRWLAEAAVHPDSPAHWILGSLESIDDALLAPLLEALPSAPPWRQHSLLLGLGRLADCTTVLRGSENAVRAAVAAVPTEVRQELRFIPEGPVTYLKAAAAATEQQGEAVPESAQLPLDPEKSWLDDTCVAHPALCLHRLRNLGSSLYIQLGSDSYWARANETALTLAENEPALRLLLSWVERSSPVEGSEKFLHHLLTAIDALAQVSPIAFKAVAEPDVWEPILTEWVQTADHWTTRLAAVRLLGLLRRVTERVAVALSAAMNDVSFVQQAAYDAAEEFHSMKSDITPELLRLLDDPDAAVAASTARLLVYLARGEGLLTDRRRILRGLKDAVAGPVGGRNVYLMHEGEARMSIQFVDRLDQVLYGAIFELSGL
ncbi:hypothetical protein ACEZDB_32840 [Streptacidiphilus sp. N1-3]|uniref:NACHT domain-containing protein n=1 Tax=Streptacidiphilus alkalitolerans TaxID=3342712 RepID=A0ABV6XB04_9ACTN